MKQYSDWEEFDIEEYAKLWYAKKITDIDRSLITGAVRALEKLNIQPESLSHVADVGVGPNLYPSMLLAPFVKPSTKGGKIDLIEFTSGNVDYLNNLLGGNPTSPPIFIWEKYDKFISRLSAKWDNSFTKLQDTAQVVAGDIFNLQPNIYDAVTSFFVTESITDELSEVKRATKSLMDSVKPGGVVIIGHMLNSNGYPAGELIFPGTPLKVEDLHELYKDYLNNITIVDPPRYPDEGHDLYHGAAVVVGTKKLTATTANTIPFTSYDTQACLFDKRRVEYFKQAIYEVVKTGDIVVDAGSGSGVLGLLSAQAGAKKVYCIEINQEYCSTIRHNAKNNGLQDKIVIIQGDATTITLPEQVDVIISEVLSGGLFYEPQQQIMQNMRKFLKPGGKAIPESMKNYLELINAQGELYGLNLSYETRHIALDDISMTTRAEYFSPNFLQDSSSYIDITKVVRCTESGKVNAIRVPYSIKFSPGTLGSEPTDFLLNPQVIFLKYPVWVNIGDYYRVSLKYQTSDSPLNCEIKVEAIS